MATTVRTTSATNSYTSSPFGKDVKFNFMQVIYTSDATVGNRQIRASLYDESDNIIWDSHAGAVQAASLEYHYEWLPGIYRETAFIDNSIQVPFPKDMIVPATYYFKVYDSANISSGDSMVLTMQYRDAHQEY